MSSRNLRMALVIGALALVPFGSCAVRAATDTELRTDTPPPQKKNEIMVPIPGFSPEVKSNGCRVRQSPDEVSEAGKAGRIEIPFWGLIEHATGRYAVHAGLEAPEKFFKRIAPLDPDMRRLVLLAALHQRFGFKDGLHTFFHERRRARARDPRCARGGRIDARA